MKISQIYIYPIKSLGAIRLQTTEVTERGLALDRRWVLVDASNVFLSQRTIPQMAKIDLEFEDNGFKITNSMNGNSILLNSESQNFEYKEIVKIWDDEILASHVSSEMDSWFSDALGIRCRLFYQDDKSIRKIDPKYSISGKEQTSLSDGYLILMISEASMELLNSKMDINIDILRFRPNIVINNVEPHLEDKIKGFSINNTHLRGVKLCSRCILPTLDPASLNYGKEPLKTLTGYRNVENKILFGQNVIIEKTGFFSVGDEIIIKE